MEEATKQILEDFGFADENELEVWSAGLCFAARWHYSIDNGPKNYGGLPKMLVTDGDCGLCLIRVASEGDDAIEIEQIACRWSSIPYKYIEDFRLAVDEADRDLRECLEEDPSAFF